MHAFSASASTEGCVEVSRFLGRLEANVCRWMQTLAWIKVWQGFLAMHLLGSHFSADFFTGDVKTDCDDFQSYIAQNSEFLHCRVGRIAG